MPLRDALGHFIGRAEAAPPASASHQLDSVTAAADALREAEQALADYQGELHVIHQALHAAQERRADCLEAGDVEAILAAETEIRRQELTWEIASRRGVDLTAAVDRARQVLGQEQWRKLQPQLNHAYAVLHTAAYELGQAIEVVRELEQQGRNLGAQVGDTPAAIGINGYLLDQWARRSEAYSQPQAA